MNQKSDQTRLTVGANVADTGDVDLNHTPGMVVIGAMIGPVVRTIVTVIMMPVMTVVAMTMMTIMFVVFRMAVFVFVIARFGGCWCNGEHRGGDKKGDQCFHSIRG
ncbi:hypothetical protein FEM03_07895 [Phragmitibacter flavus]|uniref:Uncharacterized protein n=1 Tax=Phragmitibacter flavus TaxID=2576071 RepID=A0A5R8KGM3_9BACT|nr:hypothetical protein [Phragmitibacter flavus]TLD71440.1 hypothetical protein FEM03_07895 [Phragmitibacter flavus]